MVTTTYAQVAIGSRQSLGRMYAGVNRTAGSFRSHLGITRFARHSAVAFVNDLNNAEAAAVNNAVADATTSISMNQTAGEAMDTIRGKLGLMRNLVRDVTSLYLTADEIEIKDGEYQALAGEVTAMVADTEYDGTALLSGDDAVVSLDLDSITSMSLHYLPTGAMRTISTTMADMMASEADLESQTNLLTHTINELADDAASLTPYGTSIWTVQAAMSVLASVTQRLAGKAGAAVLASQTVSKLGAIAPPVTADQISGRTDWIVG